MTTLLHIADQALNRPLLVHPDKLAVLLGVLDGRLPINVAGLAADPKAPDLSRFVGQRVARDTRGNAKSRAYRMTEDGLALIPIIGTLVNRGAWLESYSGLTSYEGIRFQIGEAAADPDVKGIILDIDSPGGAAVGCFETAAAIRAAASEKPVVAVVNGVAASAAYAIASAADRIVIGPTGIAGSIGVVMVHADYSKALDQAGVKATFIFAGKHKVDGNPYEPLPAGVRADLQAEVEKFYGLFVETVATGRSAMTPQSIRATEARMFLGQDAVDAGLADEIGTFDTALADLTTRVGGAATSRAPAAGLAASTPLPAIAAPSSPALFDASRERGLANARAQGFVAEAAQSYAKAYAEAFQESSLAERERCKSITTSAEAKARPKLALHLATKTGIAAADAIGLLATAPVEAPPKALQIAGLRASEAPLGLVTADDLAAAKAAASPDTAQTADWLTIVENLNRNGPTRPN